MKSNKAPELCLHCQSVLLEQIGEFVFYSCKTSYNYRKHVFDRSKTCSTREIESDIHIQNFLKKKP